MKYLKRYKIYCESQETETDTEVDYELRNIGEYPNIRPVDQPCEKEEDVEILEK